MKVLDLRCANGHGFEGWFGSEDDFLDQNGRGLIECPLCADRTIARMPSAPRLNLSGAREVQPASASGGSGGSGSAGAPVGTGGSGGPGPAGGAQRPTPAEPQPADLQALWLQTVRHLIANTEDVGERFAEEARRIHYGETPQRGIRGQASDDERRSLHDEGIEVMSVPVPRALKGPVQ